MAVISGGANLEAYLRTLSQKVASAKSVSAGFLAGATYPDGKPVAMIAAIQNYGAPSRGIPPRPFMSNAVAANADAWGPKLAKELEATGFDAEAALGRMGALIKGQIQTSIIETNSPPLKPATIRRKGFSKPLVDTSHMLNSVDYRVD